MTSPGADARVHAATFALLRDLLDRYGPAPNRKRKFLSVDWFAVDRALKGSGISETDDIATLKSFVSAYAPGSSLRLKYCQFVKADWPKIQDALNALDGPTTIESAAADAQTSTNHTTPPAAVAPQYRHCVRCHSEFLESRPYGCTIPHVWDDDSGQFRGQCGSWGDKLYEYTLACCPEKGLVMKEEGAGNGMYKEPKRIGLCFNGVHTVNPKAVRYNGKNVRECDAGSAEDGVCRLTWDRGAVLFGSSCLDAS